MKLAVVVLLNEVSEVYKLWDCMPSHLQGEGRARRMASGKNGRDSRGTHHLHMACLKLETLAHLDFPFHKLQLEVEGFKVFTCNNKSRIEGSAINARGL